MYYNKPFFSYFVLQKAGRFYLCSSKPNIWITCLHNSNKKSTCTSEDQNWGCMSSMLRLETMIVSWYHLRVSQPPLPDTCLSVRKELKMAVTVKTKLQKKAKLQKRQLLSGLSVLLSSLTVYYLSDVEDRKWWQLWPLIVLAKFSNSTFKKKPTFLANRWLMKCHPEKSLIMSSLEFGLRPNLASQRKELWYSFKLWHLGEKKRLF